MEKVILQVEGMSCGHCVKSVEGAVKEAGGKAKVSLETKSVEVEYDAGKANLEAIKEAIEEQDYDVK